MLLSGCMKEYPLSETQTDVVAEYMASLLLENDNGYSPLLLNYHEVAFVEDINLDEDEDELPEPTVVPEKGVTQVPEKHYTLSEVIGDSNFDINYTSYKLADTYPEDETNRVFSLDPREGYQLLVVDFLVKNLTSEDKTIDLSKSIIQYQLDINVGTIYKPQLALVENNLQYINMKVKSGDKISAVLIFEVSREIDMSDINLIASKDSKTEIIEIK